MALMIASTSWASKYSGSFLGRAELADLLGCVPRGRRLRATACVVMFPLPALQEDPRMTLADRDFLVQFNEGVQLWGIGSDARNAGIFLHMKLSRGLSD